MLVCVLSAAVVREGLPLFFLCLFILLLSVRRFPLPSSRSKNCVTVLLCVIIRTVTVWVCSYRGEEASNHVIRQLMVFFIIKTAN